MGQDQDQDQDVFEMDEKEFVDLKDELSLEEPESEDSESKETEVNESEEPETEENLGPEIDLNFNLENENEQKTEDKSTGQQEKTFNIIHNGKNITVTEQELLNLAQKGFDYEQKTTEIAPMRKLVKLVKDDKELQSLINEHVANKVIAQTSKREDFETEDEWLQDNLTKTVSKLAPVIDENNLNFLPESDSMVNQEPQEPEIVSVLRQRDSQNFDIVLPKMQEAVRHLTIAKYQEISSDPNKIIQFYDKVKELVIKSPKKTFNLRSGSRTPNRQPRNVWDLSNKDFNKIIQKTKGY